MGPANTQTMELASIILRHSVRALGHDRSSCSRCHRTPVAGEVLHVFETGKALCSLCLARLPDPERLPMRSERVHVADRPLAVVPKAA